MDWASRATGEIADGLREIQLKRPVALNQKNTGASWFRDEIAVETVCQHGSVPPATL